MKRNREQEAETQEIPGCPHDPLFSRSRRKGSGPYRRLRTPEALALVLALVSLVVLLPLRPVLEPAPPLLFLATLGLFLVPGLVTSGLVLEDAFADVARLPVAFVLSTGVFGLPGVLLLVLDRSFGEYLLLCGVLLGLSLGLALYQLVRPGPRADEDPAGGTFTWLDLPFAGLVGVLAYAATVTREEPNGDS